MPTYFIQMNERTGWTLYRGNGLTQYVQSLTAVKMLMEAAGPVDLIVLDKAGNRLN